MNFEERLKTGYPAGSLPANMASNMAMRLLGAFAKKEISIGPAYLVVGGTVNDTTESPAVFVGMGLDAPDKLPSRMPLSWFPSGYATTNVLHEAGAKYVRYPVGDILLCHGFFPACSTDCHGPVVAARLDPQAAVVADGDQIVALGPQVAGSTIRLVDSYEEWFKVLTGARGVVTDSLGGWLCATALGVPAKMTVASWTAAEIAEELGLPLTRFPDVSDLLRVRATTMKHALSQYAATFRHAALFLNK